nr:group II intron reverse transcriptase/maturase [Halanaerobium saccharolyticum]
MDKGNGKKRPLGIPALKDKIVQRAVTDILEAIFEQDFIENSYGYRPNKSAKEAVINLSEELNFGQYNYIVEADIKGFFDNIDHDWLIKMLEQRIDDQQLIRLIKKWLKAGILEEDNEIVYPKFGTPQGGIISPVLANIYLHFVLDNWFEKVIGEITEGDTHFSRYADDYITAFRYRKDAEYFYSKMQKRLNKFGLKLSLEKSSIILFSRFKKQGSKRFEFLGFEFSRSTSLRGKDIIKRRTSRKKLRKSIKNFRNWCKMMRNQKLKTLFKKLNAKLKGYYNYYGLIGNYDSLEEFFNISLKILYKWLNRRSQRKSMNWDKFEEIIGWYNVCKPRIVEKINRQLRLNFA